MGNLIIAYDLGTGGNKASLYDLQGNCLAENFVTYQTFYPRAGWHEQRPEDWWSAVVESTRLLLKAANVRPADIAALGISGHSLGVVPMDAQGTLLRESTPIWSDARPVAQTTQLFERIPEAEWYRLTGNGFPAPLYSVFKIMWYRDNEPEMFKRIHAVIGTKDYVNYRLTGRMATDFSYASGSGVYDLVGWKYSQELIEASGLPRSIFPEILPSAEVIGTLTPEAAQALGLTTQVKVVAGGVDNSCMALGARNIEDGRIYNSQGSSSWIAVTTKDPVLDEHFRPFVFTAVMPGLFNSAIPVFSSGTSFRWVRDQVCPDLVEAATKEGKDVYELMTALAATSPGGRPRRDIQPEHGRRFLHRCQHQHSRRFPRPGPRSSPRRPDPRRDGRRRHGDARGAGSIGDQDGAADGDRGGGRWRTQQALAADLRRCVPHAHRQDQYRSAGGSPGRRGPGSGGRRLLEGLPHHR